MLIDRVVWASKVGIWSCWFPMLQGSIRSVGHSSYSTTSSCPSTFPLSLQHPPKSHLKLKLGFLRRLTSKPMTTSPPTSVTLKETIVLTEKEQQLFERLRQVLNHFNLHTQLRVAGGWVRDKLLGKDCYDIDIALDNMLGREFCEKVNEYLIQAGEETHGVGVIQCNPDQSKHLETARMRLLDVWIDFVNLRSEDYSEGSRIPAMKFGTAEQDAYRRDLTINSLFYNINTSLVEDFTGRGVADLKAGRIVTPLPAKETFLDDPLRVLRAIRFGARFAFVLDEELKEAAACDEVKAAIADKISRERVGREIDLMISGNQPVKAVNYISDLQLFWVVFSLPSEAEQQTSQECDKRCVAYMDAAWDLLQLVGTSTFTDDQRRFCLYAALFLPLRKASYKDTKAKKVPLVNYIFRNSLKLKASDAETVMNLHDASERFVSLIPFITANEEVENIKIDSRIEDLELPVTARQRIVAGLLLREIKGFWWVALLVSILNYRTNHTGVFPKTAVELDASRELFQKVEGSVAEFGLDNVWEMKPLVNGKDIMSVLQLKTGGPQVREWQKRLLQWQLAHPSATAEECLDWMRETNSKRAKLG